jgi:quercetin dioxygenase-like cupin family protein
MILEKDKFIFDKEFDFNELIKVINRNNCRTDLSGNWREDYIFDNPIVLKDIHHDPYFRQTYEHLNVNFNKRNLPSTLVLIFNFQAGGKSIYHSDGADVYIIGLYGKTLMIGENDEEKLIEKGDLLHIKKGEKHRAISLTPRIICSWYCDTTLN